MLAAHPGDAYRLNAHFELFIPIGRAFDPLTNQNWEGEGITPHITAAPEDALEIAHSMALLDIIRETGVPEPAVKERIIKEAASALTRLKNS